MSDNYYYTVYITNISYSQYLLLKLKCNSTTFAKKLLIFNCIVTT